MELLAEPWKQKKNKKNKRERGKILAAITFHICISKDKIDSPQEGTQLCRGSLAPTYMH